MESSISIGITSPCSSDEDNDNNEANGLTSQNSRIRIKVLDMMSRPLEIQDFDRPYCDRSVDESGRGWQDAHRGGCRRSCGVCMGVD